MVLLIRDEFEDSYGDDVYRGGSDFYGFANDLVSDDNWATSDTVHLALIQKILIFLLVI